MRGLVLLVAIAALAAGAWLVFGSNPDGLVPIGSETDSAAQAIETSVELDGQEVEGGQERGAAAEEAGAARSQLELGEASASKDLMLRVQVVHKDREEAIADAQVSYIDGGSVPWNEMSFEEQAEYQRIANDQEKVTRIYGKKVSANSEGIALIPIDKDVQYLTLVGRQGDLYGMRSLGQDQIHDDEREFIELELETDLSLEVQVIDSLGNPANGVRVGIRPRTVTQDNAYYWEVARSEAPEGRATIPHLQLIVRNWQQLGEDTREYQVVAQIPGLLDGGITFDGQDPPAEAIVLQLPPTGSLLINTVDTEGEALATEMGRVSISLLPDPPPEDLAAYRAPRNWRWQAEPSSTGLSEFPWVVLGESFLATAYLQNESLREDFAGPSRLGERVELTLAPKRKSYTLVGRILNEAEEPLANRRFRGSMQISGRSNRGQYFSTDTEGRFRIVAGREGQEPTLEKLAIVLNNIGRTKGKPAAMFNLQRTLPLVLGKNDLGDLVLTASPVVASGRILVDGQEPEREQFGIHVERLDGERTGPRKREYWSEDQTLSLRFLEAGRFEVRGIAQQARYRLGMAPWSSPGSGGRLDYLPLEPLEFSMGSEDLLIKLATGGSLQAKLLVDDLSVVQQLFLELSPSDGRVHEEYKDPRYIMPAPFGLRLYGQYSGSQDDEYLYKWGTLWPGEYRLNIYPRGAIQPLLSMTGIQIVSGETGGDPRLEPLDLRGKLRKIKITLEDGTGKRLQQSRYGPPVIIINDPDPEAELYGYTADNSSAVILTAEPAVNLLVLAMGFMPEDIYAVSADRKVIMTPFPKIKLRISEGLANLPPDHVLRVSVSEKGRKTDKRKLNSDYMVGSTVDRWLRPPTSRSPFNAKGEVEVRVAEEGSYWLSFMLQNTKAGSSATVDKVEPSMIEIPADMESMPVFEISLPEEELQKAIEKAGEQAKNR
ncbi:MAG: hypothetical protein ACYTG5_07285 [Planctomycetota bacterium]|jgi:hypothetical protein